MRQPYQPKGSETSDGLKPPKVKSSIKVQDKTADEMFEELGYIKDFSNSDGIIEYYKYDKEVEDYLYIIRFYINSKRVWVNSLITMKELQAINKKVEELGWNE